jgi:hypothetical protein
MDRWQGKSRIFIFTALLLVLATPIASAAGDLSADLTAMVPVVGVIVIIFLALANMLATAISNPQLEAWAKTELREFAAGIILIAIIMAFFISSNGVSVALTGQSDYVGQSQTIVNGWEDNIISAYDNIVEAATRIRAAASYSSGTNIPIYWVSLNYQSSPLGGAAIFLVPLTIATQGMTNAIFLSEAIGLLLAFLKVVVPKILLPISFALRLVPFTRKLGNTMIALSLGAIVFLPLSVILADVLNGQMNIPQPAISDMGKLDADLVPVDIFAPICEFKALRFIFSLTDPLFSAVVCLPIAWIPGAFPACFNLVWQVIYPIMSMVFQILNGLTMIIWEAAQNPGNYGGDVYDALQPFLRDVSNMVMVIYLDIVLILLVTISGVRSLSAVLGGEWYMAGIQRLI